MNPTTSPNASPLTRRELVAILWSLRVVRWSVIAFGAILLAGIVYGVCSSASRGVTFLAWLPLIISVFLILFFCLPILTGAVAQALSSPNACRRWLWLSAFVSALSYAAYVITKASNVEDYPLGWPCNLGFYALGLAMVLLYRIRKGESTPKIVARIIAGTQIVIFVLFTILKLQHPQIHVLQFSESTALEVAPLNACLTYFFVLIGAECALQFRKGIAEKKAPSDNLTSCTTTT